MENNMIGTEPQPASPGPVSGIPIGGWLILLAIGLIASPFTLGYQSYMAFKPVLNYSTYHLVTTPGTQYYCMQLFYLVIFEMIVNFISVILSIILIVSFFTKRSFFPKLFIAVYLFYFFGLAADTIFTAYISHNFPVYATKGEYFSLIRMGIACAIWIPYMLVSSRVKETFVRK